MLFYVTSNIDWTLLYCLFGMIIPFVKIFIFTWVFLRIYFNFRLNRMREIQTIRVTIFFFWGYSLSNWNVTPVPSCFFEIIKRTICFSQYQLIFWNIGWTYFHFCNIQNIKSNCWIIFLKLFAVIYFWWVIFLILVILLSMIWYLKLLVDLFRFHQNLRQLLLHIEQILHLCFPDFLLLFSFLFSPKVLYMIRQV